MFVYGPWTDKKKKEKRKKMKKGKKKKKKNGMGYRVAAQLKNKRGALPCDVLRFTCSEAGAELVVGRTLCIYQD